MARLTDQEMKLVTLVTAPDEVLHMLAADIAAGSGPSNFFVSVYIISSVPKNIVMGVLINFRSAYKTAEKKEM